MKDKKRIMPFYKVFRTGNTTNVTIIIVSSYLWTYQLGWSLLRKQSFTLLDRGWGSNKKGPKKDKFLMHKCIVLLKLKLGRQWHLMH